MEREDLINQLKHVINTLEEAQKLMSKLESLANVMTEAAVQELEAIIDEEV